MYENMDVDGTLVTYANAHHEATLNFNGSFISNFKLKTQKLGLCVSELKQVSAK